jgi:hypothetical protein
MWFHWLRETEEKSAENIPGVIAGAVTLRGYVAVMLASETGQRGANWIHTRGSKTKAKKTIDVRFQVGEGNPDEDGNNYPVIRELFAWGGSEGRGRILNAIR